MTSTILAVYDNKAECFLPIYTAPTTGVGVRMFEEQCQNPESPFYRHPTDFVLFELGEIDLLLGVIQDHERNINLGMAQNFMNAKPPVPESNATTWKE